MSSASPKPTKTPKNLTKRKAGLASAPRVAVYLRVSTLDQEKGIKSQEHALSAFLANHGIEEATWYRDRLSGASLRRPDFERLQRDIFAGRIKTVVVWSLDRVSRSMLDGVSVLRQWLDRDVRIISVTQQLDFSGITGQLVASVLLAVAQMQRETLREATKRGMQAAASRGARIGKRPSLFAKDIIPLLKAGKSISESAKLLGCTRQSIYNCLEREGIKANAIISGK